MPQSVISEHFTITPETLAKQGILGQNKEKQNNDKNTFHLPRQSIIKWEWKGTEKEYLYLSVNISVKDFYYMDIYEEITRLVEKYGISPEKLKLEITETVLMTEMKNQMELLDRLRKYGFQIEMDDFGSGYSSLNMLKDIEVDVVKIDMEFLRQTDRKTRSMLILNHIIHLIKQLGMEVITEGVETKEQVEELVEMGCDMFQGYYFAKPMPVEKFEEGITDGTGSYL